MSEVLQFGPLGNILTLSVGNTATASTALPGAGGDSCRLVNTGAVHMAVLFATADQAAPVASFANASIVLNANEDKIVSLPVGTTVVSAIADALGPTNLYLQRGSGGT